MDMNIDYLKRELKNIEILYVDNIDSTMNIEHFKNFRSNENILIANTQSSGIGRYGRHFVSPKNTGLYFTYKFCLDINDKDLYKLTPLAGVALGQAIEEVTLKAIKIKWLNDIYIDGYKVAGILIRVNRYVDNIAEILVGIGVNIYDSDEIKSIISNKVASILGNNIGHKLCKEGILISFINNFKNILNNINSATYNNYYNAHLLYRNQIINCIINNREKEEIMLLGVNKNYDIIVKIQDNISVFTDGQIKFTQ